jgi:hypothetical protein
MHDVFPFISFTDAYEAAGLSYRSGKFKLNKTSNYTEFEFKRTGWFRKKIKFQAGNEIIISEDGVILNGDGGLTPKVGHF